MLKTSGSKDGCLPLCFQKHQFLPNQTTTQRWTFQTKPGPQGFLKSVLGVLKCRSVEARRKRSNSYVF